MSIISEKVINLEDYRSKSVEEKTKDEISLEEYGIDTNPKEFFDEMRATKRKEKGIWD